MWLSTNNFRIGWWGNCLPHCWPLSKMGLFGQLNVIERWKQYNSEDWHQPCAIQISYYQSTAFPVIVSEQCFPMHCNIFKMDRCNQREQWADMAVQPAYKASPHCGCWMLSFLYPYTMRGWPAVCCWQEWRFSGQVCNWSSFRISPKDMDLLWCTFSLRRHNRHRRPHLSSIIPGSKFVPYLSWG